MLLSEREMGLSDEHEGIVELPESAEVGADAADAMGLSDPVIEIGLTPNRPDCAGVRGIARDLAAAGLGTLRPLGAAAVSGESESPVAWRRELPQGAGDACPLVVGRHFRDVSNGPSPQWMQDRLLAVGLRPISALVDITNYVSLDLARPLHVFDADRLSGDAVMRFARAGESLEALDGETYALDESMTVIADDSGVIALGGVMGGMATGVSGETRNAFLEVALFDPVRTARTGRALGIVSDARYRFERGVDPESARWGVDVATGLVLEHCGGAASRTTEAGEMPGRRREIVLRKTRALSLGGLDLPGGEQASILSALGFEPVDEGEVIRVRPPSWRPDIDGEADLVEEVLRIRGYDDIPTAPFAAPQTVPAPSWPPERRRESAARRALAARGMAEAVTFSFMKRETAELFGFSDEALAIDNPISADLDVMRPSILPNLLAAAGRNANRGHRDVALFEVGPEYSGAGDDGQATVAAGIRAGLRVARHWSGPAREADVWDAKADALAALAAAGAPVGGLRVARDAPAWFHPGRSGVLRLGRDALAVFGDLHPRVLRALGLEGAAVGFAVHLDRLPPARRPPAPPPLPPFQPVRRDFAFVVDADVEADDVLRAARGAARDLIADIGVFDVYEHESLGEGRKSVAVAVTLQPVERTPTDAEIEAVARKISGAVEKRTGGTLRT